MSIPVYSLKARAALDLFVEHVNDVNFYVEDINQENLYHILLSRMFPSIRIGRIFPLGGKLNVVSHAQDPSNASRKCRSVYLLDLDFDDLHKTRVRQDNVFYLDRYCIENYLLEPSAIVEVAVECEPTTHRSDMERRLQCRAYLRTTIRRALPLFRLFYTIQRLGLPIRNSDLAPEVFCAKNRRSELDPTCVKAFFQEAFTCAQKSGHVRHRRAFHSLVRYAFGPQSDGQKRVSGKFLLRLLQHHLRVNDVPLGTTTLNSLRYRLAKNGTLAELAPVKRRISSYLRKQRRQRSTLTQK